MKNSWDKSLQRANHLKSTIHLPSESNPNSTCHKCNQQQSTHLIPHRRESLKHHWTVFKNCHRGRVTHLRVARTGCIRVTYSMRKNYRLGTWLSPQLTAANNSNARPTTQPSTKKVSRSAISHQAPRRPSRRFAKSRC